MAIDSILVPKLAALVRHYPDIKIELIVDYGLTNIVAERYDAGVRSGEQVEKDMIAVRYRARHAHGCGRRAILQGIRNQSGLRTSSSLSALTSAAPRESLCLGIRKSEPGAQGSSLWPIYLQHSAQLLRRTLGGLGLAYLPEGMVHPYLRRRRLKRVLDDWCPPFSGYHLFYSSRRQSSAAFSLVVDALRHRH